MSEDLMHVKLSTEEDDGNEKGNRRGAPSHLLLLLATITVLCVLAVYQTWNQAKLSSRITELELIQRTLLDFVNSKQNDRASSSSDPLRRKGHLTEMTTSRPGLRDPSNMLDRKRWRFLFEEGQGVESGEEELMPNQVPVDRRRTKREAEILKSEKQRERRRKNKSRKAKIPGAHFRVHVDSDKLLRELAEGRKPTAGNFTKYGFQTNDRIYDIWKPEKWSNKRLFRYNATSGKVKVMSTGLYLIYAQIMFHSPYFRKSFAIHINDEVKPYVEALSFGSMKNSIRRHKREADLLDPDSYADLHAADQHRIRHRRSGMAEYSQCNTMAIAYIKKNDQVFLKSLEQKRSVIAREYLTFWGLVKL